MSGNAEDACFYEVTPSHAGLQGGGQGGGHSNSGRSRGGTVPWNVAVTRTADGKGLQLVRGGLYDVSCQDFTLDMEYPGATRAGVSGECSWRCEAARD